MNSQGTGDQTRSADASAEPLSGVCRRHLELRMLGESKIIVGGKVDQRLTDTIDARSIDRIGGAQLPIQ